MSGELWRNHGKVFKIPSKENSDSRSNPISLGSSSRRPFSSLQNVSSGFVKKVRIDKETPTPPQFNKTVSPDPVQSPLDDEKGKIPKSYTPVSPQHPEKLNLPRSDIYNEQDELLKKLDEDIDAFLNTKQDIGLEDGIVYVLVFNIFQSSF